MFEAVQEARDLARPWRGVLYGNDVHKVWIIVISEPDATPRIKLHGPACLVEACLVEAVHVFHPTGQFF